MAALPVLAALLLLVYAGAAPTAPSAVCYRRANVTLADCAITIGAALIIIGLMQDAEEDELTE